MMIKVILLLASFPILVKYIKHDRPYHGVYIDRDMTEDFKRRSTVHGVIALAGPRQSGKTTLLREMAKGRSTNYVLFDEPRNRDLFEGDLDMFDTQFMAGHDITILDEVHYCKDAGSRLKYLVDSGRRMWVTSSSEIILSKEVLAFLGGRVGILRLYPFNLREFMRAKGWKVSTPDIIKSMVSEHMTYGGYPQVVLADSAQAKADILRDLHTTMLLKDVARTFSIGDLDTLERLARYLAATPGGIMDYNRTGAALDTTYKTLRKYLHAMERGHVVRSVPPFFTNRAKEIVKRPKYYYLDNGLRNAVMGEFPIEVDGRSFESYVLAELVKMGHEPRHWRSKGKSEVDFVVRMGAGIVPVEVRLSASSGDVERGLRTFISTYRPKVAIVVYLDGTPRVRKVEDCSVAFMDVGGLWEALGDGPVVPPERERGGPERD
jgi:predicted AAA+ superfamily ATPase